MSVSMCVRERKIGSDHVPLLSVRYIRERVSRAAIELSDPYIYRSPIAIFVVLPFGRVVVTDRHICSSPIR